MFLLFPFLQYLKSRGFVKVTKLILAVAGKFPVRTQLIAFDCELDYPLWLSLG